MSSYIVTMEKKNLLIGAILIIALVLTGCLGTEEDMIPEDEEFDDPMEQDPMEEPENDFEDPAQDPADEDGGEIP